jgi:hypothetical protein
MSKFKKTGDIKLINGGYLSATDDKPINNKAFVELQRNAEWLVTLANKMKGKNFKGTVAVNINDLVNETNDELNGDKEVTFVSTPSAPSSKITDELKKEALSFIDHQKSSDAAEKVNKKLQKFKLIQEFEDFGLFFTAGVAKLNKIYTMKEITAAAVTIYAVLD